MFMNLVNRVRHSWKLQHFLVKYCSYYHLRNLYHYRQRYFFSTIEIETINYCTRRCPWCPMSQYEREKKHMDPSLYRKIIDELSAMRFRGWIDLFLYSEPLLDPNLSEWIRYAKQRCPHALVRIDTNGDPLTLEKLRELLTDGLDSCLINQYGAKVTPRVQQILDALNPSERSRVHLKIRHDHELGNNRGGLLDHIEKVDTLSLPCVNPQVQFVIDVDGNAVLCCDDFLSQVVFGNVRNERILDIWNKPDYHCARQALARGNRNINDLCRKCNGRIDPTSRFLNALI